MGVVALDTSAAVPLLLQNHSSHERLQRWARGKNLALCSHSLAETYSVLTRLPGDSRFTEADAVRVIDGTFERVLSLPEAASRDVHHRLADAGIKGGAVYDGLIALTALENEASLASMDKRAYANYFALGAMLELIP
ncbi:PIN domain-containing protein [Corynebacterium urinipleomorphum]|uniref:PIN domain-containing protein n=1 Tax=Corynebacterium urinipleomorphum TaxID=1852380 RepID=UPI000B35C27D|nr:PIN domain-containing protein [Corynebacterium urinipleomorphum]